MTRFKDDKAPWMPRINGDRFRSRIVCVRSSTPGIHTRTRAYTHTHTHTHSRLHPPFPLWKSSLRETYFRLPSDFSASSKREGRGCVWKLLFSFSPFIRFFRSSIVSDWQFHYTLDGLSTLNNNVKLEGGGWEPLWFRLLGFAAFCWINFDERNRTIVVVFFFYFTVTKEIL